MVFTQEQVKQVGDELEVDWSRISLEELTLGVNEELEHEDTLGTADIVTMAGIALDHLKEDPQYYTKLLRPKLYTEESEALTIQRLPSRRVDVKPRCLSSWKRLC